MREINWSLKTCNNVQRLHRKTVEQCMERLARNAHADPASQQPFIAELRLRQDQLLSFDRAVRSCIKTNRAKFDAAVAGGAGHKAIRSTIYDARARLARESFHLKIALPSFAFRDRFVEVMREHNIVIVKGATGSGKSTQLAQYCAEESDGLVLCAQPRKLAASGLADRVAFEFGGGDLVKAQPEWSAVGREIGLIIPGRRAKVGFKTRVVYSTMSFVMRLIQAEQSNRAVIGGEGGGAAAAAAPPTAPRGIGKIRSLHDVRVLIIDEAHERSLDIDLILGWLQMNASTLPDLKVVVTSATLDTAKFARFFAQPSGDPAPVVDIPGKTFPIEFTYQPVAPRELEKRLVQHVVRAALDVHRTTAVEEGDILCFLTAQVEVEQAKRQFEAMVRCGDAQPSAVFALHGGASPEEQKAAAFDKMPAGTRRVVFATTVAETSLTIDGIVFVIDSGLTKTAVFDPRRNASVLAVQNVSKSSAIQRAGRAGRTQPGRCIRLFSEPDYQAFRDEPLPDMQRSPLELTMLRVIQLGYNPADFSWLDKPSDAAVSKALDRLAQLGAADGNTVTAFGTLALAVEQDPAAAKIIHCAFEDGYVHAGVLLASLVLFGSNRFFFLPPSAAGNAAREQAAQAHTHLIGDTGKSGDLVALYHVLVAYCKVDTSTAGGAEAGGAEEDPFRLTEAAIRQLDAEYKEVGTMHAPGGFAAVVEESASVISGSNSHTSDHPELAADMSSASGSSAGDAFSVASDSGSDLGHGASMAGSSQSDAGDCNESTDDASVQSAGSVTSYATTRDYELACRLKPAKHAEDWARRRFARTNCLNNKTLGQILQTSSDMLRAYLDARRRLHMEPVVQLDDPVPDAYLQKLICDVQQRNNVAFRVGDSWLAQRGAVDARLSEQAPFTRHAPGVKAVVYTSLFTTDRGTRLCDVTPVQLTESPELPQRCSIRDLHPRVVKEFLGPRNWRQQEIEAQHDCFLDVSPAADMISIITLPGPNSQLRNVQVEKVLGQKLAAIRARLCAAAHVVDLNAHNRVVVSAGMTTDGEASFLFGTEHVCAVIDGAPSGKSDSEIKAFLCAGSNDSVTDDIQVLSSAEGKGATIMARFKTCHDASQFVRNHDKQHWDGHQLSVQLGSSVCTMHAASQLRCHAKLQVLCEPSRGMAVLRFGSAQEANSCIGTLLSVGVRTCADKMLEPPEGWRVNPDHPHPANPRWTCAMFEQCAGEGQPSGGGGAKAGRFEARSPRRAYDFRVCCFKLDPRVDDSQLGMYCMQARLHPHSIEVKRGSPTGDTAQVSERVNDIRYFLHQTCKLEANTQLTEQFSAGSRAPIPAFMMDEAPLPKVTETVAAINEHRAELEGLGMLPIRAVAHMELRMTMHFSLYAKLSRQISDIVAVAKAASLSVRITKPNRPKPGQPRGNPANQRVIILLSNESCQWQHAMPVHFGTQPGPLIQAQADDLNAAAAALTSLTRFTSPELKGVGALMSRPGRDLMQKIDGEVEDGFIFWDSTSRTIRLFGSAGARRELEVRLESGLGELRSKQHTLPIHPHKFQAAMREKYRIQKAGDAGLYSIFARSDGHAGPRMEIFCEAASLERVRSELEGKGMLNHGAAGVAAEAGEQCCQVCFCELDFANEECVTFLHCRHTFHVECIDSQLNPNEANVDGLPLRCFMCAHSGQGAAADITVPDLRDLCQSAKFRTWVDIAVQKTLTNLDNPSMEYCPNGCNTLLQVHRPAEWQDELHAACSTWNPFVECPECDKRFCMRCSREDSAAVEVDRDCDGHNTGLSKYESCAHFRQQKKLLGGVDLDSISRRVLLALDLVCPRYPKCGAVLHESEKEGCDAATCPQCSQHFCWFCWKMHTGSGPAHSCAASHGGEFWNPQKAVAQQHKQRRLTQLQRAIRREIPQDREGSAALREALVRMIERELRDVGISMMDQLF
jgi:hypothetical protein